MAKIREKFSGLNFSQMKGCVIIDKEGNKIGKLQDAIFKKKGTQIDLTKFLVGGTLIEELLEDFRIKSDIDPVFPVSVIEGVSPKGIRLNVSKGELKATTLDKDAIESDEVKLSQLEQYQLLDNNQAQIGNIIDVTFRSKDFTFVVGEGFLRETLEDWGILNDIDLVLEPAHITELGENHISISKSKLELEETFEKHIPKFKRLDLDEALDKMGGQKQGPIGFYPKSTI